MGGREGNRMTCSQSKSFVIDRFVKTPTIAFVQREGMRYSGYSNTVHVAWAAKLTHAPIDGATNQRAVKLWISIA